MRTGPRVAALRSRRRLSNRRVRFLQGFGVERDAGKRDVLAFETDAGGCRRINPPVRLPGRRLTEMAYRNGVNRRSRRLLLTTKTELKAIAAPAISGLSKPIAASGNAATL